MNDRRERRTRGTADGTGAANGWAWLDTWVSGGRFRTRYLPGGVVTGRWSSVGSGALQIPAAIRGAVGAAKERGAMLLVAGSFYLCAEVKNWLASHPLERE